MTRDETIVAFNAYPPEIWRATVCAVSGSSTLSLAQIANDGSTLDERSVTVSTAVSFYSLLASAWNPRTNYLVITKLGSDVYLNYSGSDNLILNPTGVDPSRPTPSANSRRLSAGAVYTIPEILPSVTSGSTLVSSSGSEWTPPPSGWAAGSTDWTASSTPALPANIRAIYVDLSPGLVCTLKLDGGGRTGQVFNNVPGGEWWPVSPGTNITKIYTPSNGSTSAVIDVVLS